MHPALSVIFFTVISGCGFGVLFLLGVLLAIDPQLSGRSEALIALSLGGVFAAIGLASSLLHLGQPQRAWRALSQWRSSWLSREGVAALATFLPALALAWLLWRGDAGPGLRIAGALLAGCAALTVWCTARIYSSLKTIPAWRNALVLPGYLLFALLGGGVWLWLFDAAIAGGRMRAPLPVAVAFLAALCALLKRDYWILVDRGDHASTPESATGLGRFGTVRSVEAPHTEENYLTREMGFALARKHAARLRVIALVLFACLPVLAAILVEFVVPAGSLKLHIAIAFIAAVGTTAGIFVERWLFFAQAKHLVMLYYGARVERS
jgi:sulfite dehydrogenase (quinone) subunit SoeC